MRNTPYVSGRRINIAKEILPVAAPDVVRQIILQEGTYTLIKESYHDVENPDQLRAFSTLP